MRMSRLFSHTLREAPAEAEIPSHQLLLRAGFIRQLATGVFSYLPLARRSMTKIEQIIRAEMDAIGGQEISMPVVHPAELWQETGRWYEIDAEMGRLKDRSGRDMVLGMTHEEVIGDLARKEIHSYRQLPQMVYQIQTKWRDDPRPRAGLIRGREFIMKDSYTLDTDWAGLEQQYRAHYQAYFNIFHRCGLEVIAVGGDTGMMGGKLAHEYMYLTPIGEDTLILCDACGSAANRQAAEIRKPAPRVEEGLPVEEVATPDCKTIASLAQFLGISEAQTAKAVLMVATMAQKNPNGLRETREQFVFAVVRGDMELNETKLANAIKAQSLRPATEDEIRAVGAEPGYASPVGLKNVLVVVDELAAASPNLVSGANKAGYHLRNVNYGRDYTAQIVTDLVAAREGDACPNCGGLLQAERGVEVGNIFQLGTRYSDALGATYLNAEGQNKPIIMGSYGLGVTRLLACIAEEYHDEHGLAWPVTVAPFEVHLVRLTGRGSSATAETADRLYASLCSAGIEILYDERDESPGVKFKDADLIGLPLRLTVGERGLQADQVEMKWRTQADRTMIAVDDVVMTVRGELERVKAEMEARVVPVVYR